MLACPFSKLLFALGLWGLGNTVTLSLVFLMEEIMEGWGRLSLQGPKEDGFRLRSEMGFEEFILATKFFTK